MRLPTLKERLAALEQRAAKPSEGPSTVFYTGEPPEVPPRGCRVMLPMKDPLPPELSDDWPPQRDHSDEEQTTAEQPEQSAPETVELLPAPAAPPPAPPPAPAAPKPAANHEPRAYGSVARSWWPETGGRLW